MRSVAGGKFLMNEEDHSKTVNKGLHLFFLMFNGLDEFYLRPCAIQIVFRPVYPEISVS